jgi:hypothetical protein
MHGGQRSFACAVMWAILGISTSVKSPVVRMERRRSVSGFSRLGVYGKKMSVALFVVGLRGKGFEAICCELARKAEQVTLLLELLALCRDG